MIIRRPGWTMAAVLAGIVVFAASAGALSANARPVAPVAVASVEGAPLVVILDTSGSMADTVSATGGGSVVKLSAAKAALEAPIRNLPAGTQLGIWTYPSPSDDACSAGGWVKELKSKTSTTDVLASIDALSAGGNTPTGQAIQAVVDSLRTQGVTAANILLVSDGLSTCGVDACAVAQQLAGSDFDLGVQAVGFDIDPAGREELECISSATGGHYFDVSDGEELEAVVDELTTPILELTVDADPQPQAGGAMNITVTLSNPSTFDAHDVRMNLAFRDAGARTVFPAVVPATIRIGNLPAGQTVVRSWQIVAGEPGRVSDAEYAVTAWSAESGVLRHDGAFTTRDDDFATTDVGEVFGAFITRGDSLVIMGDSFSSGEGAGNYLPASTGVVDKCHRSRDTYLAPVFTAAEIDVRILACSGATSTHIYADQVNAKYGDGMADAQLWQLKALSAVPGAVVITLGGNDIGFAGIVANCVQGSCASDGAAMDEILARPAKAERALSNVYRDVWTEINKSSRVEARHGAYAPVVVLAYPQVAHDNRLGPCANVFLDSAEVEFANDVVLALNASIKRAVASARASGYEVYFVDRTHDALLPDHSVCESGGSQWVNGILLGLTSEWPPVKSESFHPKSTGFRAIGSAVIRWSQSAVRVPATASAKRAAGNSGGLVDDVTDRWAASQALERLDLDKGGLRTFSPLQTFAITGSGFAPNTQVAVELHSIPTIVGTLWTDEHGEINGYLTMPPHLEYGQHEIVVSGIGESGDFLQKVVDVQVVPQTPLWVVAVLGASVIAAIGSVVLFLIRRRKDRLLTPSPN